MGNRKLVESFSCASEGILHALRTERNLRVHIIIAILVMVAAVLLDLPRLEMIILFITISLVIIMELINTSIEAFVDLISPEYHPAAKVAKNVAAGAVFVTAANALVVGFLVFFNRLDEFTLDFLGWIREHPGYFSFLVIVSVLAVIFFLKVWRKDIVNLKGGMPSGHAAVAFSLATLSLFFSDKPIIIFSSYLMAILVAQSRVEGNIHSLPEVFLGGLLGFLITFGFFQFFLG